ncbi:hypothetical protein ETB97_011001 [Aspergillus alliaceus]|uniref:P-loop containing nucleoside triphosphate hydrolase protein n=1 Tax=Petromyces alliaceus TaxID=209559 RepID=A0A8H6E1M4_PETAA|nr:hypothetical protein ETB97_011001 [Aspergillus burnettii]
MGGYMVLASTGWVSTNGTMWTTSARIAPRSGTVLHSRLLDKIPVCGSYQKIYLRRNCFTTVPQDPFTLTGATLRFNFDREQNLPDATLIDTLEKTGLWDHFRNFSTKGLSATGEPLLGLLMSSLPALSAGQLQLLLLSRALVHARSTLYLEIHDTETHYAPGRKPILLLDEATSTVDPDTEAVLQEVIQEEFTRQGHTVTIVAHRVSSMVKYFRDGVDAVVWTNEGRIENVTHTHEAAGFELEEGSEERKGYNNTRPIIYTYLELSPSPIFA